MLKSPQQLSLACWRVAEYHNYIAYNTPADDGFAADMAARELQIAAFLEEPSSDDECHPYSDDDT